MSHYHHLSISERESIWEDKLLGKSLCEIAKNIGRSVSTVSRELKNALNLRKIAVVLDTLRAIWCIVAVTSCILSRW